MSAQSSVYENKDPPHPTFASWPELSSAVSLWKQDPCAELFIQWMDFSQLKFEDCLFQSGLNFVNLKYVSSDRNFNLFAL